MKVKILFMIGITLLFSQQILKAQSTTSGPGIGNVFAANKFLGWNANNAGGDLPFRTNNVTRMIIQNNTGFVSIGTNFTNPQSMLHLDNVNTNQTFMQFTNTLSGNLNNTSGFKLGLNFNGNAELHNYLPAGPVDFFTTNMTHLRRMRITADAINNQPRVSIGSIDVPMAYLHLGSYVFGQAGNNAPGYRDWMNVGTLCTFESDNMYVGLRRIGTDHHEAIINWGNNPSTQPLISDKLRFVFTTVQAGGNPAGTLGGQETARMVTNGINSKMGVGDFFTLGTDPKRQMDIYDNGNDTANGRPQLRLSQELFPSLTLGTYTDFQTVGNSNNTYAPDGISGGHLLINPRSKGIMRAVAINMENGSTPDFAELSLDVNGQQNIRWVNPDPNNNLNQILVRDPNNHGRIMWRDASTIGGDYDWQHIVNTGVFSGHINTDGYNERGVYVGLIPSMVPLLTYPTKFCAYSDFGENSPTNYGSITGGFINSFVAQTTHSRSYAIVGVANGHSCFEDSQNYGIKATAQGAFMNYGGFFQVNSTACANQSYAVYAQCNNTTGAQNYAGYFNGDFMYTGSFGYQSDIKLKENISSLNHSLSLITQLNPVQFTFKNSSFPSMNMPTGTQFGLIAQEVEPILPEIVKSSIHPAQYDDLGIMTADTFSFKTIDYIKLIPHMIQAIKELSNKNDSLMQEIVSIQSQLSQCCTQQSRLMQTDVNATIQISSDPTMKQTQLYQNRPNPFNAKTTFAYTLGEGGNVELIVEDSYGRLITTLISQNQNSGEYSVDWNAENITSGIYFYSLKVNGVVIVKKAMKF